MFQYWIFLHSIYLRKLFLLYFAAETPLFTAETRKLEATLVPKHVQ